MTLIRKAQILSVVILVTVATVLAVTLRSTQTIVDLNDEIAGTGTPFYIAAQDFRLNVVQIQQWLTDISATRAQDGLNDGFDQAEEHYRDAKNNLDTLAALDPDENAFYTEVVSSLDNYYATGQRMAQTYIDQGPQGGNRMMSSFDETAELITGQVETLLQRAARRNADLLDQASEKSHNAKLFITLMVAIGGAVVLGGTWLLMTAIMPLRKLTEETLRIADNDLTGTIPRTGNKDEVGQLAEAVESMQGKLRRRVQEIAEVGHKINAAVDTMNGIVEQTNRDVQQQYSETEMVATAMNQMTATVHEVASNTAAAADSATDADKEVNEGGKVVRETITMIEKLASEIRKGSDTISRLDSESSNIGTVLDVIKNIAEQTNLLALNAAIEAARAGEQGRGFAVVADEVRTLAQRTQESTREIQQMIENLQQGAREAVQVMNESRSQADASVAQAGHAGRSLDSIHNAVSTIHDMTTQIASAAEEQGAVADEINRNIINISQVVERTAEGSTQISSTGEGLGKLVGELQSVVARFKL